MEMESNNFLADCKVYHKVTDVNIEFYSDVKDPTTEAAIEAMLNSNLLVWDKTEYYIEAEDVTQIVYGIQL